MKKIISFVAALCCTMFLTANAETYSGSCGESLNWSLNTETTVLDITGSGEMYDYDYDGSPWYDNRYSITSVNLPNGITYIGSYAFYDCDNLHSVTIPENVTAYGIYPFYDCNFLTSVVWNARNAQPRSAEGKLFMSYSSSVTSFTFGNNVETIPDYICFYMTGLTSISIPNSVTSIGEAAFYSCSGLSSITLPNNLISIGNEAFAECTGLTSIIISENVAELGYNIFRGCSSLSSLIWNAKDAKCKKDDYGYGIFNYEEARHITSFTIGDAVAVLPNYLCRNMAITSIIIPENVKEIGNRVFAECSELRTVIWNARNAQGTMDEYGYYNSIFDYEVAQNITSFTIGNSVETIPHYMCCNMSQLSAITIPNGVTSIGNGAFSGCDGLTSITIPNNVTSIGASAFSGCDNVSVIIIGKNVTTIERNAFGWCSSLQVVNFLGTDVKSIGNGAFAGCTSMQSINLPNGVETLGGEIFVECTFPSILIPQSVKSIGSEAFSQNKYLKSVTISNPDAVCEGNMFVLCDSLETLVVPASAVYIDITQIDYMPSHIKSITVTGGELTESAFDFMTHSYRTVLSLDCGAATNTALSDEAYKGCYNLQSLILPQNLTYISYMAVAGCKNLKAVDIPASVVEIEQSAFEDCRSMEELTFGGKKPNSKPGRHFAAAEKSQLRRIGNWAFYNAHELQHLEIPEGVEEIGDAAFYGCTYLEDLVLPSTVQAIGDNCFALCSKLQQITITSLVPPIIRARTFYDVSRAIPVYVLDEVVEDYLDAPYWNEMNIMGGATAINNVSTDNQLVSSTKILRDGQIYILRNDKTYTLTGAEVK